MKAEVTGDRGREDQGPKEVRNIKLDEKETGWTLQNYREGGKAKGRGLGKKFIVLPKIQDEAALLLRLVDGEVGGRGLWEGGKHDALVEELLEKEVGVRVGTSSRRGVAGKSPGQAKGRPDLKRDGGASAVSESTLKAQLGRRPRQGSHRCVVRVQEQLNLELKKLALEKMKNRRRKPPLKNRVPEHPLKCLEAPTMLTWPEGEQLGER